MANSSFARGLWKARQTLFPPFERKPYHLQFRHAALITMMLLCASFTLPAFHQTPTWPESFYGPSTELPIESSYNKVHRFVIGVMYYNVFLAFFIGLHLVVEPFCRRGAPVWYEMAWMSLLAVGEAACLGLMASSRPDVCNYHFGIDTTDPQNGKFSPKNSATSICSNWLGMTGMLATIIAVFLLHVVWHAVVSTRHLSTRKNVFVHPITDYRWNLPAPLERIHVVFPTDVEASSVSERKESKDLGSTQYSSTDYTAKSLQSDTLSFPAATTSEDYSNFSRPTASGTTAKLHALPASAKPVVLEQSIVTRSDTSSIVESDHASSTHSPNKYAPFAYDSRI